MNLLKGIASPTILIEIGHSSMKVVDGDDGLELSLDRVESGRLTPVCAERLIASLRIFLKKHLWRSRLRAVCAIGARGVSLRRLSLPGNPSDDELERLLPLQIEREFPLSPEELAWGYCKLGKQAGENGTQVLVAAVKKDIIEQYEEILNGCGISATYILAAAARGSLCPAVGAFSVLDIGRSHSELISFRNSLPEAVRVFSWGGENVTRAIEKNFGVAHAEAEKSKISGVPPESSNGAPRLNLQSVIDEELDQFAKSLPLSSVDHRLYLTGGGARLSQVGSRLAAALGSGAQCEPIETFNGEGRSAAIVALSRSGGEAQCGTLVLRPGLSRAQEKAPRPVALKWAILAVALLLGCLSLRYAEPFLNKPRLVRQLADVKAYRETLPRIERELSFFDFIRTNQPAYLEPLFALANAAPSGTKIESVSMNKRGDMSLRASMKDPQQLTQLRSKLIESGLFTSVVVEEQTPSSDRQKLSVRMSGHFKPTEKAADITPASGNRSRSTRTAAGTNAPPASATNAAPAAAKTDHRHRHRVMRPITEREKRTIRFAVAAIAIYLVLFFGVRTFRKLETQRSDYQRLVTEARRLKRDLLPYEARVLMAQKLKQTYAMDPGKLSRSTVVAEASAAIQKAASAGKVQLGPMRESPARASNRELTSIQIEASGPVSAVMTLLHKLPTLGYPLIVDTVQLTPESKPGNIKLSLNIIILDAEQWLKEVPNV